MFAAAVFLSKDAQYSPEAIKLSARGIAIIHSVFYNPKGEKKNGWGKEENEQTSLSAIRMNEFQF